MQRILSVTPILVITILWSLAIGYPVSLASWGLITEFNSARQIINESAVWAIQSVPKLLLGTTFWGIGVSLSAIVLALPAAFFIATTQTARGRRLIIAGCITVLCTPPYISYWVYGLLRLPGSALGDFLAQSSIATHNLAGNLQLFIGLTLWVWPIPTLTIAAALRQIPRNRSDLLTLDAVRAPHRLLILLTEARTGLFLGFGIAFLAVSGAAVVFDLASTQTRNLSTYTEALRRLHAETGSNSAILLASLPLSTLGLIIALVLARFLKDPPPEAPLNQIRSSRAAASLTGLLILFAAGTPIFLMLRALGFTLEPFRQLTHTDGQSLLDGMVLTICTGTALSLLTLGAALAWGFSRTKPLSRFIVNLQALTWVGVALVPAITIGTGLVLAYNTPFTSAIYNSPLIIILGYLARYGFLAILVGHWLAVNQARTIDDLMQIDGATNLPAYLTACGPTLFTTSIATGTIGALLSLSEITTTVIITPPNIQSPAERLLNRLHYAREDAAMATCLIIITLTITIGFIAAYFIQPPQLNPPENTTTPPPHQDKRFAARIFTPLLLIPLMLTFLLLPACKPPNNDSDQVTPTTTRTAQPDADTSAAAPPAPPAPPALPPINGRPLEFIFGSAGQRNGQFRYPRGIAADPERNRLYILDRTGRFQIFDADGNYTATYWLPKFEFGYATGITIQPKTGNIFIADTHNSRVIVFSPAGEVLQIIGSYGFAPGEFIYPTDIAFADDGRFFVSEYGGNDRVQVFNEKGEFLHQIGHAKINADSFVRPQALYYDNLRAELWVADSCNHRIVIYAPDGRLIRTIGTYGTEPGTFCYVYSILPLPDDSILVSEFGNNRFQRIDRAGNTLEILGKFGNQPGEFNSPWSMAMLGARLYLLDSRNNRVQVLHWDSTN